MNKFGLHLYNVDVRESEDADAAYCRKPRAKVVSPYRKQIALICDEQPKDQLGSQNLIFSAFET